MIKNNMKNFIRGRIILNLFDVEYVVFFFSVDSKLKVLPMYYVTLCALMKRVKGSLNSQSFFLTEEKKMIRTSFFDMLSSKL